jgi:CRISPR/Cas system-associated endoribonuclease Cas2
VRNNLKQKRTEAYGNHYQNSVYGAESQIIDVEFELLESNRKILTDSKLEKSRLGTERKQRIQEYVRSAYTN